MSILLSTVLTVVLTLLFCIIVVSLLVEFYNKRFAEKYEEVTGRKTKYVRFNDWYILANSGYWYTESEYKCLISGAIDNIKHH